MLIKKKAATRNDYWVFLFLLFSSSDHWWKIYSKIVSSIIIQHLNKSIAIFLLNLNAMFNVFQLRNNKKKNRKITFQCILKCGEGKMLKKKRKFIFKDKKMQTKVIEIIYRFFVASPSFIESYIGSYSFFETFYRHYFDVLWKLASNKSVEVFINHVMECFFYCW